MKLSIGQMSERSNLGIHTLRYYEELGLIEPERDENNRRVYSEKDLVWLEFVMRLKKVNMPMKEIIRYSQLRYEGDGTVRERMGMLEEQMKKLEEEKREIENSMDILSKKIEIYRGMLR